MIEQLRVIQATGTAAGHGGLQWDAFYDLLVRLLAEAEDPNARAHEIADLLENKWKADQLTRINERGEHQ
ncbi:hypothetical protein ACFWN1_17980 [Streptomyces sp. NPDC058459]|uniref:hypothetical protein n=1 Tax=Streptomyces sp. NPDC058459 TaxID=3346508 RepID=UPI00364EB0F6